LAGTISVQFMLVAAAAAVWLRLMALPDASTGLACARPGRPDSGFTAVAAGLAAAVVAVGHGAPEATAPAGAEAEVLAEVLADAPAGVLADVLAGDAAPDGTVQLASAD
jgi:hypothetical protein